MSIHATAVVHPEARIHPEAEIGPYVVIEGPVAIGRGTRVRAHAYLSGWTEIGEDNEIHAGAIIGEEPQDLSFQGESSYVKIGDRNVIREHAEIHRATEGGSATVIGNDNYLMSHAHVAHNCRLGNRTVISSGALLAGYVTVGDRVVVSGNCTVHQFVRIGTLAFLRGLSRTSRDVPPYCIMDDTHTVKGLNRVGLQRAGYGPERIREIQRAFSRLFRRKCNLAEAIAEIEAAGALSEDVAHLLDFIKSSERGVCFGPKQA